MLTDKVFTDIKEESDLFGNNIKSENFHWQPTGVKSPGSVPQNDKSSPSLTDGGKLLLQYSKEGDCGKVQELIMKGAPFTSDWLGTTPLHFAAMSNNHDLCEILLRSGISKDAKTKVDRTPLHFAVYDGHEKIVESLLNAKCDIDVKDMLKMTPLHWAIERRFPDIARMLLKHGADTTIVSKFDKTPLTLALQTGQIELIDDIQQAADMKLRNLEQVEKKSNNTLFEQCQSETVNAVNSLEVEEEANEEVSLPSVMVDKTITSDSIDNMDVQTEETINESVPNVNSPVSNHINDSNSNSNIEMDNIDYIEPIVQLQNLREPKQINESALQILKSHGISMLKDTENTLLQSALENGRKLVLSEAGKIILNETKTQKFSHPLDNTANVQNNDNVKKQLVNNNNSLNFISKFNKKLPVDRIQSQVKSNKNVKIISMETFKKMCAENNMSTVKKIGKTSIHKLSGRPIITRVHRKLDGNEVQTPIPQKLRKISPELAMQLKLHKLKPKKSTTIEATKIDDLMMSRIKQEDENELPPNIVEVSENSSDDSPNSSLNIVSPPRSKQNLSSADQRIAEAYNGHNLTINPVKLVNYKQTDLRKNISPVQTIDILEISRQLTELRKQVEELQKQFELSQKQNEEYRLRIEALEKERDLHRDSDDIYI